MNALPAPPSPARRLASVLLIACTLLALANLPGDDLPPGWLAAFVLPGAVLARLAPLTPAPWQRALSAAVLQALACWLALELVGPMSRPAALACTILPPLGFATARHHDADQALALFLSFCVMLVGTILDGPHVPLLAAYGVCACLSLRCANHLSAQAASRVAAAARAPDSVRGVFGGAIGLVAGTLFATLAIERAIAWLPSPSQSRSAGSASAPAAPGPRQVGLDDSFHLDGTRGVLSELTGEQLVRVRHADGRPLANDLYLRSGFFTVSGLDRWQLGPLASTNHGNRDRHTLRPTWAGVPVLQIELERFAGARNFVFVPPASCRVIGLDDVVLDPEREWVRQGQHRDTGPYLVDYQQLPALGLNDRVDERARRELLRLPRDFDRTRYDALLTQWAVGADPLTAMAGIAAGLAAHCRYDRIEPLGPFGNAIENFLFAPADRRGYCMHFASAAALLLRLRGIPCRIGVGLYGGAPDRGDPGARIFGSQHAHAWVEIPFAERGFVVFDPTPPADRGRATPSQLDDTGLEQPDPAAAAASGVTWLDDALALATQPWLLTTLLLALLLASTWPRRGRPPSEAPAPPAMRSARRMLARLLQALAAAGHPRARGQTLEAFARTLAAQDRLPGEVAAAFAAYQQVRFGGRRFDADRERDLRAGIDAAVALPPPNAPLDAAASSTAERATVG